MELHRFAEKIDAKGFKSPGEPADASCVSDTPTSAPSSESIAGNVELEVVDGTVRIVANSARGSSAELSWPTDSVDVTLFGERVEGTSCRVPAGAVLRVMPRITPAQVRYGVLISRDRMDASLGVVPVPGVSRELLDAGPSSVLRLQVVETRIEPGEPTSADATAALQRATVMHGLVQEEVELALEDVGVERIVARGTDPIEGSNGRFEHLIDFDEVRHTGVLEGTPLVRRIPSRHGTPGRDVTGQELRVAAVKDVRLRPGAGVSVDEGGLLAVATVDGAPHLDPDGRVEVRHELVLEAVDTVSGDISFHGSVRVEGDVCEGHR
jgi:hypothetical protein